MIKTKTVEQTITGNNINHYINLGYTVKQKDKLIIPIEHLPKKSRCKIEAVCDICKKELIMNFAVYNIYAAKQGFYTCIKCKTKKTIQTNMKKYGVAHVSQNKKVHNKMKKTNLKKYGVAHVTQSEEILNKMKKTNAKRYGVEYVSQLENIQLQCKETRIQNGFQTPDELKSKWELYNLLVDKFTRKNKKELFSKWDGLDFYDKENIKENLKLHHTNKRYPTIDHKISIFYGFKNNLSPEEIGNIQNLCITKRTLNAKKNIKCEL